LANLIFATWRFVAGFLSPGMVSFSFIWIVSAGLIYLCVLRWVIANSTLAAILAWVAPAPIYFSVFRFDIYPAAATMLALIAIRNNSFMQGAIWLGVAAALKGYALFMLPAFCVFVVYRRGILAGFYAVTLGVLPLILTFFITLIFVDLNEVLTPFKLQATRGFNGESTYDAINYLLGTDFRLEKLPFLPQLLQLVSAMAAAAMRPKNFDELLNALIFAVLGYITFSAFYSPQFLLWLLPLVSFSCSRALAISMVAFSWLTFLYFPISYSLLGRPWLSLAVLSATTLRIFMMLLIAFKSLRTFRRYRPTTLRQDAARPALH